ncbi:DUF454 family protein [Paenibacillus tepidiphilus]|uniref:DUF454 family protein n=1 Tax=Paenibacillus tepidiphilus TaxID=2608683 RepID=UPI0013A58868|nr:DUF454 family protein [Paenibacillus tepidiphilus]
MDAAAAEKSAETPRSGRLKRWTFLILGILLIGIGAIGIVLPLLPTTPLWLLASLCLARGSERLDNWLKGTAFFRSQVQPIMDGHGMTLKKKAAITATVWTMLLIMFVRTDLPVVKIVAVSLGLIQVSLFIWLKTAPPQGAAAAGSEDGGQA